MEKAKMDRINFLARKSKAEGLTELEIIEQAELRKEYIAEFRNSMRSHLDNMYIVEADGSKTKVRSKKEKM